MTFLLTDIEGSTRLWEASGAAMAEAVPLHYALLADAIERHGGVRPVEQGEGDSVMAAFARASDAVAAALQAQLALSRQPWPAGLDLRVRIALHAAEAQIRDEGNYFGVALSRCARLRGIAHGGQSLLSRAVHDLTVDRLPDGATLVDLGIHRLRDLGRPEHIYALSHPDLPDVVEPLRSLDALPNNLPDQLTTFIGRKHELEEVTSLLDSTRLVTLTGAGGCGKTRLATQAAAEALERFPGGVWWVELAPVPDAAGVDQALAESLSVRPLPGQSSRDAVIAKLAGASVLLVLDNCEHLLEASAETTEALLRACPEVTVLSTSRAPLGVPGETAWRVPSLSLPDNAQIEPLGALTQCDAVRLFIERALQVRPNFTVNADNAPAIAQTCHDLDGIPLAIELAAARVRVLSPQQIAAGLGDRFRLLTGGARSAMPRQQTLRASVDWSHDLLSDDERVLFRRLAVFSGGWTLDAVEEVCAGNRLGRMAILDLLTSLVDKSMVAAEERGGGMRYRLLETVRQYALDRLTVAGEREFVRDRHRDFFVSLAERVAPRLYAAAPGVWLDALDLEAANLALAAARAAETDGERALRLCIALTVWWKFRGRFELADAMYLKALDAPGAESSALRARAVWARAYLLVYAGRLDEAFATAGDALELAELSNDTAIAARALTAIGSVLMLRDPLAAQPELERARELARESGDDWCLAESTEILASTFMMQADLGALRLFEEAYEVYERGGYAEFVAWYWWGLGLARQSEGRDEEALASYQRAIDAADAVGEPVSGGNAQGFRALLRAERGQGATALAELQPAMEYAIATGAGLAMPALLAGTFYAQASIGQLEQARDSLTWYVEANIGGGPYGTASALTFLARIELCLGESNKAAAHTRAARKMNDTQLRNPLIDATARQHLAATALAKHEPSDAERIAHEALTAAVEHGFRPLLYPVLDILAGVAVTLKSFEEGARILGAAERAREEIGHVRWAREQERIDTLHQLVQAELGQDAYAQALQDGRAMTTNEAIGWLRRARGTRKRPAGGWESLTPTEVRVVHLAGKGLSNPEIAKRMLVSRGTVKVHLSHIYAKLDIRNRSELAALAAKREAN